MTEDLHSHGYFRIGVASHQLVVGDVEQLPSDSRNLTHFTDMNCDGSASRNGCHWLHYWHLVLQDRLLDQQATC